MIEKRLVIITCEACENILAYKLIQCNEQTKHILDIVPNGLCRNCVCSELDIFEALHFEWATELLRKINEHYTSVEWAKSLNWRASIKNLLKEIKLGAKKNVT